MDRHHKEGEGWVRLVVGFALNIPLYFVIRQLATWRSIDQEFRLEFVGGSLAAATLVFVTPGRLARSGLASALGIRADIFLSGFRNRLRRDKSATLLVKSMRPL